MPAAAPLRRLSGPARSEAAIQATIIEYLGWALPGCVVHANANAARRTASGRASNAIPGLLPGVPDLSVDYPFGRHLYFEVKTPKGVLSDVQSEVIGRLCGIGCYVAVVTGIDDVRDALRGWGVTTRERAA